MTPPDDNELRHSLAALLEAVRPQALKAVREFVQSDDPRNDHDQDTSKSRLARFTGSEQWFRHALVRSVLYTDGAQYLAEQGGAYWLIDEIALAQRYDKRVAGEEFQHWKLAVDLDQHKGVLTCDDGNGNIVFSKRIPFTDFPLLESTLYYVNNTILLPSEY